MNSATTRMYRVSPEREGLRSNNSVVVSSGRKIKSLDIVIMKIQE